MDAGTEEVGQREGGATDILTKTRIEKLVEEEFTPSHDPEGLADILFSKLSRDEIKQSARAWVLLCIERRRRHLERVEQGKALSALGQKTLAKARDAGFRSNSSMNSHFLKLGRLVDQTFSLGDGRHIAWGEATIFNHQERIDYMRKQISGFERDIQLHVVVMQLIRDKGVSTLAEALRKL